MPTKTIPTLGAVAAAQSEEKKKSGLAQALGVIASALGISGDQKPVAKMTKKTLTTKRVELEESDDEESEAEAEEESEAEAGAEAEEESTGSTGDDEEPAKEEDASEAEEASAETESDRALAHAVSKAMNSPAVHQAFLAALPAKYRDVGALYSPHRLASAAKKATAQTTTFAAMGALAELNQRSKGAAEKMLAKQAKLETRVAKVEGLRRKDRVDAIVGAAKERGVPGATSKEGRAMLRAYGMQHGTTQLSAFIQSQGPGLRTRATLPKTDEAGNAIGAPTNEEQARLMKQAMAGLTPEQQKEFQVLAAEKLKASTGASEVERV